MASAASSVGSTPVESSPSSTVKTLAKPLQPRFLKILEAAGLDGSKTASFDIRGENQIFFRASQICLKYNPESDRAYFLDYRDKHTTFYITLSDVEGSPRLFEVAWLKQLING